LASVDVLKRVAKALKLSTPARPPVEVPDGPTVITPSSKVPPTLPSTIHEAIDTQMEDCDLTTYCVEFMSTVKTQQSRAALQILKTALSTIVDTSVDLTKSPSLTTSRTAANVIEDADETDEEDSDASDNSFPGDDLPSKRAPFPARTRELLAKDRTLQKVAEGLLYGTISKDAEISSQSKVLFEGLANHILLLISSHSQYIARLDGNGFIVDDIRTPSPTVGKQQVNSPMPPMGSFRLLSPLHDGADPFVINYAFVTMLCDGSEDAREAAVSMIKYLVVRALDMASGDPSVAICHPLFEHLLSTLLRACFDKPWNLKAGAYDGIFALCRSLSLNFASPFETQIMTAALFILKDSPREVSSAAVEGSLSFLIHMLTLFHGGMDPNDELWKDALALPDVVGAEETKITKAVDDNEGVAMEVDASVEYKAPPPETIFMLTNELTSTKQNVRFGARLAIQHISNKLGTPIASLLKVHEAHLKKSLYGKSFGILPLVQQVAITETLTFLVSKAPGMLDLDTNLVSSLKGMLNAGSDFDGSETSGSSTSASTTPHASAIFLRGPSSLSPAVTGGPTITIQSELPHGIQLRVSAILFCRALIHKNPVGFFMNNSIKGLSDVRTSAMNLIFRSIISSHPQAILASHATLTDIVELSEKTVGELDENFNVKIGGEKDVDSETKTDIFQREKLTFYLKPILNKVKDHRHLSLHLSSGLKKLLMLLGSRFESPLAELLLQHLQNFKNPQKVVDTKYFRQGEEPLIAASVISLFELLPNVEQLLELLVDVTLTLEADIVTFKRFNEAFSPYKVPLTVYLSNHPELASKFFLDPKRFGKTEYISFFVSILKLSEAKAIRDYLSSDEGTELLLGISLGTALAIANHDENREEEDEGNGDEGDNENGKIIDPLKTRHGVPSAPSWGPKLKRSSASQQQLDLEVKDSIEKLKVAKEKHKSMKTALQNAISNASKTNPGAPDNNVKSAQDQERKTKSTLDEAQESARLANDALEASKSYAQASATYDIIRKQKGAPPANTTVMTLDSLEWMYQGLRIYEVLISLDETYVKKDRHNEVFDAMRVCWRSKGRQIRLANEECLLHNFKLESKVRRRI